MTTARASRATSATPTACSQDAEIHFTGSTVLDNGLEVGARIELTGEDDADSQIDESWIYFSGGFGEVRMGSLDDALALHVRVPAGRDRELFRLLPQPVGRQHRHQQQRLHRRG